MGESRLSRRLIVDKFRAWTSIHRYHLDRHLRGFSTEIGHSSVTLDVGSGKSPFEHVFDSNKYVAVDHNVFDRVHVLGDVCMLPFKAGSMDLVLCTEVIEHVRNTGQALNEILRVSKKGGYLVLTVPLLIGMHDEADYFRFTETMLTGLLEEHGFVILQIKKRGGILSALGAILLQTPFQVLGISETQQNPKHKRLLAAFLYVLLVPLARLLVIMDPLDKTRRFTLGYDCLCKNGV
jgi:SAM-dependent methyltransferase